MDISLENDEIILTINDTEVETWQFSLSESSGGPMAILDCINLYGPAGLVDYYVDDFEFIQTAAPVDHPEIELSATEFTVDGSANQTITVTNSGEEDF